MTQNFREEFKNARLAAANKFLGDLADNFKERINTANIIHPTSAYAHASFGNVSLLKVSQKELLGLEGFIKLKQVCADPSVDMALGPNAYELTRYPDQPVHSLSVYVAKPYADSGFLQAEKEQEAAQKKNRPGILRRAFARLKNRREAPVRSGTIIVSSNRPVARIVTEPITPPPSLS